MTEKGPHPVLPILAGDDEMPWLNRLTLVLERSGRFDNFVKCDDSLQVMEILRRQMIA